MWRTLLTLILLVTFSHLSTSPSHAQATVFTEDFETDFHQWQPTRDNGNNWLLLNGQADVYLEKPQTITEMVPKDEFWDQSWENLEYELDYIPLTGVDRNISFGFQNLNNWYEIHFIENLYNILKVKSGQKTFDIFRPFHLENGQSYRIKIIFHTGFIQVYINNQLIAEEYDFTFKEDYGKIGIKVSTGAAYPTHVRFDNLVVRQLSDEGLHLTVPFLKQNDPRWAGLEYDHAREWSTNPTFSRWACALTSMVMIMKYHGLEMLPNGSEVTPATLNTWLLNQPDGYVGQGLLNWVAVSRLTKLISQKFGTPKLEYVWQGTNPYQAALHELALQRPVILHIPEHFLVATGHTANKQDLYINDPFYDFSKFFEHQQDLLSIRTFVPSQTDLSYLVIAHDSNLDLKLTTATGQQLSNLQTFTESLTATDNSEKTTSTTLHYLAKPKSQTLNLRLQTATLQPFKLQIFSYDAEGNLQDLTQTGLIGNKPLNYTISYSRDNSSLASIQATWSNLQQHLFSISQQSQQIYYTSFLKLNQTIEYAKNQTLPNQIRYARLFQQQLEILKPSYNLEIYNFLKQYAQDLLHQLTRAGP